MNPIQNPLFKEPIGACFTAKREMLGLSIEDAAKSMKFSTNFVQAIENEQWDILGPAIYAKSYISSYIKLLGLDESIKNEIPNLSDGNPTLSTIIQPRVEPLGIQSKSILAILSLIGLSILFIFLYNRNDTVETATIDNSIPLSVPASSTNIVPIIPANTIVSNVQPVQTPIEVGTQQLLIRTKQEAWLEIRDLKNRVVFSELIPANQERTHNLIEIGKITLGNASSVQLLVNNNLQSITAFIKRDDVARFTIDEKGTFVALTP
jgi:cytoskeleton protein RodZ